MERDAHLERIEAKLDLLIAIQDSYAARLPSVHVVASKQSPLAEAITQAIESLAALQASMDQGFAALKEHIGKGAAPWP